MKKFFGILLSVGAMVVLLGSLTGCPDTPKKAGDKPAADKPAADKPAADKPAADKPADKK